MNLNDAFGISAAVIASVGGAGAIIFSLSSWLGKVWSTRLMDSERHKNKKELTSITEAIKNKNNIELEKLKSAIESNSYVFKLDKEHEYEQRKKIKEVISKNKIKIINSAEALNHRMWNFNSNHEKQWHFSKDKKIDDQYYLYSFVYRFLAFFSLCDIAEEEMVYLDSTVSTEKDLDFIKFLKILPQIMCDTALFEGLTYNNSHDTDHFFKNDFHTILGQIQMDKELISFDEFKKKIESEDINVNKAVEFISGISPNKEQPRWFRLQSMHYVLLMFINTFGYDFQHTSLPQISELKKMHKNNPTLKNLDKMLFKIMLQDNNEVRSIIKELKA